MPPPNSCAASCDAPRPQGAGPATRTTARSCVGHQGGPAGPGPALAPPAGGTGRPGCRAHQAGQHGRASAVGPARHWPGQRWAAAGNRWRQPGAAGQRGRLRAAVWPGPAARLLGPDRSSPPQPGAATATPTMPCGASPRSACTAMNPPRPMSSAAPNKAHPSSTSCAPSSATSPERPTTTSSTNQTPHPAAKNGSVEHRGPAVCWLG
jgi:hypothetical protein